MVRYAMPRLFDQFGTVAVSVTTEPFIVRSTFVLNRRRRVKPEVRISHMNRNFSQWFLDLVEQPIPAVLHYGRLTRAEKEDVICAAIGAESGKTSFAHVWTLMKLGLTRLAHCFVAFVA